jgi:NADPH-dependent 2,4-dienoyl-CoA reductase/sulfur reductase-like enzyme
MGAPLKNGVVANGHVRCPWHGACFNVRTGDIEEYPCSDALPTYQVREEADGDLIVCSTRAALKLTKRAPTLPAVGSAPRSGATTLIIGAGPAGGACAEKLRELGYAGRVVLIGDEPWLPYDRTKLSKAMTVTGDRIQLRTAAFYASMNIELMTKTRVTELDVAKKQVTLRDAGDANAATRVLTFDNVVVCTGGTPRTLPVPGFASGRVYQLRVPADTQHIYEGCEGKRLVVIGSSFIGMEAAAALAKRASSVAVIGMEKVAFERVLGFDVGARIQRLHESNGIRFHMQRTVKAIEADADGNVKAVVLDNGVRLDADICVVGAGVVPATSFVKGVPLETDGSLLCDETMRVAPGVYAAGDLARFPYAPLRSTIRVEHYGYAQLQGSVAAANIAGKRTACAAVPFFWTAQFGKSVRYAGHALGYDKVHVDGDLEALDFIAYYARGEAVLAVSGMGRDQDVAAAAELLASGRFPALSAIVKNKSKMTAVLSKR